MEEKVQRFRLGHVVATPGALEALEEAGEIAHPYLFKHMTGDWGIVCEEDKASNEAAIEEGSRILSAYILSTGVKIWIITEWNRSYTTLLLPEDY